MYRASRNIIKPHQGCFSASLAVMRLAGSSVSRRLSRSKPASERPPRVSRALGAGNLVRSRLYGCCGNLICSRKGQGSWFQEGFSALEPGAQQVVRLLRELDLQPNGSGF